MALDLSLLNPSEGLEEAARNMLTQVYVYSEQLRAGRPIGPHTFPGGKHVHDQGPTSHILSAFCCFSQQVSSRTLNLNLNLNLNLSVSPGYKGTAQLTNTGRFSIHKPLLNIYIYISLIYH